MKKKYINLAELIENRYNETYGKVPENDVELREYVEKFKQIQMIHIDDLQFEVDSLKDELTKTKKLLAQSKSYRESILEQELVTMKCKYSELYNSLKFIIRDSENPE